MIYRHPTSNQIIFPLKLGHGKDTLYENIATHENDKFDIVQAISISSSYRKI